jgi:hypothetical protein
MSDTPLGPDWWQASDDKWYPPPRPEMPGEEAPADGSALPPPVGSPGGAPTGPPVAPPSGGYAPPGPPGSGSYPPGAAPSPYTGVPPAGPPGAQNRTPLYVAIGVVVAVAIVGLIIVLTSGDDDERTDPPEPGPTTTEEQPDPTPTTGTTEDQEPQSGGSVEVVEVGWSNYMGGFDNDELTASYGFIVENTGDETVTDIQVSVSAFDADGTALATDSHTIYMLRPGQKMGIGDEFWGENLPAEVADVQVAVSEPQNWSLSDIPEEGVLEAEGVTTTTGNYDVKTTFTIHSTFDRQISSPYGYAIYRDANGDIIGGSTGYLNFVPANGSTAGEITSWEVIPNIASTEVYIDIGYIG